VGGVIGVLVGVFLSYGAKVVSKGSMEISIPPLVVVGSVVFSIVIGILFGLYPASNAARLSPVEALRYE
jgi:putative ABC transport system permease protein